MKRDERPSGSPEQEQQFDTRTDDGSEDDTFLHCVDCLQAITRQADRSDVNGRHRHVFTNPHGYVYQIGCFVQAPGVVGAGGQVSTFTWFPGYTWQIVLCSHCFSLMGWAFRSSQSQFFGLILAQLTTISP